MKLLINNKEIAHFLLELIDYNKQLKQLPFDHLHEHEYVAEFNSKHGMKNPNELEQSDKDKFKDKIYKSIRKDLDKHITKCKDYLEYKRERNYKVVHENIEHFIEQIGISNIFKMYKNHEKQNFVKSVGFNINENAQFIRRHEFNNYKKDCLIRNTVGNEDLLVTKIDKGFPFWFIDSGYTNFLEPNKKWHRIVRNHLHFGKFFDAPVDRLGNFKKFPKKWRQDGDKILIIEPGPFAAQVFHVDLTTWKYDVEKELRKYTDKQIVFREKAPKRQRSDLFKELCNEDYYCIVSINSNAATEAIWAGIPAITMDRHITNPVTVSKIEDVNNLYRGDLSKWLCMLSYSQFTFDELTSGKALNIYREYHV